MINKKSLLLSVSALGFVVSCPAYSLTTEDLGTSDKITWEEVSSSGSDIISVILPDGTKFYKYTYTQPADYVASDQIENPSQDVTDLVFKNLSDVYRGAAIVNGNDPNKINVTADFLDNYASYAGAIYRANFGTLNGDFIANHALSNISDAEVHGGALDSGTIDVINGDFIGNYAQNTRETSDVEGRTSASGGAIYNVDISTINGNFVGNYSSSENSSSSGGAIYNGSDHTIGSINSHFIANYAVGSSGYGGAIYNAGTISEISGQFIGNYATTEGDAISNIGTIEKITADFLDNGAANFSTYGTLSNSGTINEISDSEFNANQTTSTGGALFNRGTIDKIERVSFIGNSAQSGGAIYEDPTQDSTIGEIINSTFKDNHAQEGGAITTHSGLKITADNGTTEFTGNYVLTDGERVSNAIYVATNVSEEVDLTFNAVNGGNILINDGIDGVEGYSIDLIGDESAQINLNEKIHNAMVLNEGANVFLGNPQVFQDNSRLIINSGIVSLPKLGVDDTIEADSITLNGGVFNILEADVDLAGQRMGQFASDIVTSNGGTIHIDNFLLTSDGAANITAVPFAEEAYKSAVTTSADKALTPVYQYNVRYDPQTGEFIFSREDPNPNPDPDPDPNPNPNPNPNPDPSDFDLSYRNFNPAVYSGAVALASALNTQTDLINQISSMSTSIDYYCNRGRLWALPYYSDDTVEFKDFYDVDRHNYGIIAGIDTRTFGNYSGLNAVYTLFGAFNRGKNEFQNVKVKTNSWMAGLKASVYQGGFYGDVLVNYTYHDSDLNTMYGQDSVHNNGYGAGGKVGYRFDVQDFLIDTSAILNWQRIEGKDYTSKSTAKIKTSDFSQTTLTPQIKVGYDFNKYFNPYVLARYNFVLDETGHTRANRIALPDFRSKDYWEYGIGAEIIPDNRQGGYAQLLRHDDGCKGWNVTLGYKYNF